MSEKKDVQPAVPGGCQAKPPLLSVTLPYPRYFTSAFSLLFDHGCVMRIAGDRGSLQWRRAATWYLINVNDQSVQASQYRNR